MSELTHLDDEGRVRMVDVTAKDATRREAVAGGAVHMAPETLERLESGQVGKGEVLAVARVAAIQAAKRTSEWIPLCHPVPLTGIDVELAPAHDPPRVEIRVTARCTAGTGVEMEALVGASAAGLTIYDMLKAVDRGMRLGPFRLLEKRGGRSGEWRADAEPAGSLS